MKTRKLSERFSQKQKDFLHNLPDWDVVISDEDSSVVLKPRLVSGWNRLQRIEDVVSFLDFCQKVNEVAMYYDSTSEALEWCDGEIECVNMRWLLSASEELEDKLQCLTKELAVFLASEDLEEKTV